LNDGRAGHGVLLQRHTATVKPHLLSYG
jgi:hypothetical protein